MGIVIDLIAVGIVVISALIAYYKGFVKTFFGFVSVILAILLACMFAKPLGNHIKESTELDEWIIDSITSIGVVEKQEEYSSLSGEGISGEILVDYENEESSKFEISKEELANMINALPSKVESMVDLSEVKENTINSIAIKISDIVIDVFSWILIYFVVKIVSAVAIVIFNGIMKLPILKSINNLAGLLLGAIVGIFRIYLVLAIIYFISSLFTIATVVTAIQQSMLVNAMYNSNLIISLIF